MALSEAEALERITRMVAATYEPTLDVTELADLVDLARRPDADGNLPDATGWVPTWDLNYAAAEGWSWKAGKAAADFDYSDDAGSYSRSSVYDAAVEREKHYRSRAIGSLPMSKNEPHLETPVG